METTKEKYNRIKQEHKEYRQALLKCIQFIHQLEDLVPTEPCESNPCACSGSCFHPKVKQVDKYLSTLYDIL
jgi:hypothetical protein